MPTRWICKEIPSCKRLLPRPQSRWIDAQSFLWALFFNLTFRWLTLDVQNLQESRTWTAIVIFNIWLRKKAGRPAICVALIDPTCWMVFDGNRNHPVPFDGRRLFNLYLLRKKEIQFAASLIRCPSPFLWIIIISFLFFFCCGSRTHEHTMEVSEGHPTALIRLHHGERASTTLFALFWL